MPAFLRNPWIWASGLVLLSLLAVAGAFLSTQIGDETWWPRAAEPYNREHAVPKDQNAFAALAALRNQAWQGHSSSGTTQPWNLPMSASDVAVLRSCPWDMPSIRRIASFPFMHQPLNTRTAFPDPDLSHLYALSNLHRVIVWKAQEAASQGNPSEAARCLETALRLSCQSGPSVGYEQSTATVMRLHTWSAWERLAMDTPPSPDILESSAGTMAALAARRPGLREYWEGEMLRYRGILEALYHPSRGAALEDMFGMAGPEGGLHNVKVWFLRALQDPLSKCRTEHEIMTEIFARGRPTEADGVRYQRLLSDGSEFMRTFAAIYDVWQKNYWKDIALERGVRTLMLLQAFKLRQGRYPDTLEELKASTPQEVPDTNWDGKPFVYKRLEDGSFRLVLTDTLSLPTPMKTPGPGKMPSP